MEESTIIAHKEVWAVNTPAFIKGEVKALKKKNV